MKLNERRPRNGGGAHVVALMACSCATVALAVGCQDRRDAEDVAEAVATPVVRRLELGQHRVVLDSPLFRVGGSAAQGPLALGRVNGGVVDGRGRIWVGDDLAGHVVRVGPDGNSVDIIGRRGRGPMEFLQVAVVGWSQGRVVVFDQEQGRLTLIDPVADTGTVTPAHPMWQGQPLLVMAGVGANGEIAFTPFTTQRIGPGYDPPHAEWVTVPPTQTVVVDRTGAYRLVFSQPQPEFYYFDGEDYLKTPFATAIRSAVLSDVVVLVGTMGGDVLVSGLDGDHPKALNVGATPGTKVDDETVDAVRRLQHAMPAEERRGYVSVSFVAQHGLPRLPYFDWVVASRNGALWVRHAAEALTGRSVWEVLTPEGEYLGTATLPDGERVLAVDSARVATLRHDENDAAVLSVYRNPLTG